MKAYYRLTVAGALTLLSMGAAVAEVREWRFDVFLDDAPIGYHRFELRPRGEKQLLESTAEFTVKVLFIPVYRYRHQSAETWEAGCLKRIAASTDDNGDRFEVDGAAGAYGFSVSNLDGRREIPGCVMTFAYWDKEFLGEKHLLNVQTGEYVDVTSRFAGDEVIEVDGQLRNAARYELLADGMRINLWYSSDGDWLGLESLTSKGRVIRYELADSGPGRIVRTDS